jgi:PRTRC genetic system protein E
MFKELSPLLKKGDTLILTVSRESDTHLRVNVTPRLFTLDGERSENRKALNTPVSLAGTIEELDSPEFAAQLDRFTTSVAGLRLSIEEAEAAHQAAKPKPKSGKSTPSTSSTKSTDKDDDKEEDEEKEKPEPHKKPAAKPTAEELTPDLLGGS